jgi:hypothetical protein
VSAFLFFFHLSWRIKVEKKWILMVKVGGLIVWRRGKIGITTYVQQKLRHQVPSLGDNVQYRGVRFAAADGHLSCQIR